MKNLLLCCLFLFTTNSSYCQASGNPVSLPKLSLKDNKITYISIITVDSSMSKEKLFDNAQQWYRHNFESADNVLIIDNRGDGEIAGTGIIHARKHEKETDQGDLFFNVDIIVTRGAYQYRVDSIYSFEQTDKFYYSDMYNEELYPPAKPKWAKTYRETMLNNMNTRISSMTDKLRSAMAIR